MSKNRRRIQNIITKNDKNKNAKINHQLKKKQQMKKYKNTQEKEEAKAPIGQADRGLG